MFFQNNYGRQNTISKFNWHTVKYAYFFIDKRFEISNRDLIRDMDRIIKLREVLLIYNPCTFLQ